MTESVLITGVSGFIGGHLARLLPAAGLRVVGAVRRPDQTAHLARELGCEVVCLSPDDQVAWRKALQSVDYVVHAAGLAHRLRPSRADVVHFFAANETMTAQVASACGEAGVRRLINLSSIAVIAHETQWGSSNATPPTEMLRSTAEHHPQSAYGLSKLAGEQAARQILQGSSCDLLNARIPAVYGPSMKGNLPRLLRWIRSGIPLPVGAFSHPRSYLSIWNLADFMTAALRAPPRFQLNLAVADHEQYSTPELIALLGGLMDKPVRIIGGRSAWIATLAKWVGRARDIERLQQSTVIDLEPLREHFQWQPPYSAKECWQRVLSGEAPPQ
jgi:nucleoside-diphosphate-sugar epimerase